MIQGSNEWRQARCGSVGASRIADILAETKSGPGASRKNYAAELVVERLTGIPADRFVNAAMVHGTDTEPQARAIYTMTTGNLVAEVGLVPHPTIKGAHASPDGMVGDDGLVEIKCPNTAQHIEALLKREVADRYVKQMQFQLACTGRKWCDFVSFDPRLPDDLQMWIKRVERDEEHICMIEAAVRGFLIDVEGTVRRLCKLGEAARWTA